MSILCCIFAVIVSLVTLSRRCGIDVDVTSFIEPPFVLGWVFHHPTIRRRHHHTIGKLHQSWTRSMPQHHAITKSPLLLTTVYPTKSVFCSSRAVLLSSRTTTDDDDDDKVEIVVQLIQDDMKVGSVTLVSVPKTNPTVDAIKMEVKNKFTSELNGILHTRLLVYSAFDNNTTSLSPFITWDAANHGGDASNRPLIVKAPPARQQQQRPTTEISVAVEEAKRRSEAQNHGQQFLDSFTTKCDMDDLGDGMRVMKNVVGLGSGELIDVIVRSIAEPFWQVCIDTCETNYRVCATGTSGIGKSISIVIPIRMLLEMGKTVVFHVRTKREDGWIYEFIPTSRNGGMSYTCNVYPESQGVSRVPSMDSPNTYYIVDPGRSVDSCDLSHAYAYTKVIIVSSPDEKHWGGSQFAKNRFHIEPRFKHYPLWTEEELIRASPHMGINISTHEIQRRFALFGGVPGQIFVKDENFLNDTLQEQVWAASLVPEDQARLLFRNALNAVTTKYDRMPKSELIGIAATDDRTFSRRLAVPVSKRADFLIAVRSLPLLWERMDTYKDGYKIFGAYIKCLVTSQEPCNFYCRPCAGKRKADKSEFIDQEKNFALGGTCTSARDSDDMYASAQNEQNILFYSSSKSNETALVDSMVYSTFENDMKQFYVLQVAMGGKHTLKIKRLIHICEQLNSTKNKVTFFIFVQAKHFNKFVTDPVNPMEELAEAGFHDVDIWITRVPHPYDLDYWNALHMTADWDPDNGIQNLTILGPAGCSSTTGY